MTAEVIITSQSLTIDGVTDVAVTAITHDDVKGDYYRDITLFGEAEEEETTTPTVLTVRIRAATAGPLKISVPADEF